MHATRMRAGYVDRFACEAIGAPRIITPRRSTVRRLPLLLLTCVAAAVTPERAAAKPDGELASALQPLIDAHRGQAAVAVKHLASGAAFT
ncbi:MAG: hypothetical protein AAF961_13105, partial [Planctomycetota bacterium]